ncbi:hypothetical protein GCM10007216_10430 [Thalassobacillus devorans]|uniref:Uncharacterized protein n=1 Tax=Thalassobacillus devorans TaxID=279813 RepID=A0ABQ1NQ25_9BACI|nr:hypothetical protein [Thalassobacillus devorans]NIK29016.1 hypothetical protein [Thalassobacillus devorans]GGC81814.1 hypothetical protein GCM10007216_10430 [Thalassobacillus devorans]
MGLSLDGAEEKDTLEIINGVKVAIDPHIKDMTNSLRLEKRPHGLVLAGIPASDC